MHNLVLQERKLFGANIYTYLNEKECDEMLETKPNIFSLDINNTRYVLGRKNTSRARHLPHFLARKFLAIQLTAWDMWSSCCCDSSYILSLH